VSAQVNDIIRLGSFVIPILILLLAGQSVRFDPNRRLSRPSIVRAKIKPYEQPWGAILLLIRGLLVALVLLDLAEITLMSLRAQTLLAFLPTWAIFQNPSGSAIYAMLALLAIWFIGFLKRMSINIFDQVFESHLEFADWRTADAERDARPHLHLANWRYDMKWNFKTNPEPIDALHMRMIIECPTFADFEQRILHDKYPESFKSILEYSPYGWIIGDTATLMRRDVLHGLYRAPTLWAIWEKQPNPYAKGMFIDSPDAMADMLYTEIRGLLVCKQCRAHPDLIGDCNACNGSGARMVHCLNCRGLGLSENKRSCKECGGLGLHHRPIPITFMNRLQYLWMARNVDLMKRLFPVWLSNRTYLAILVISASLFFGASLLFQAAPNVDLLVQTFLFGEAVLLGMLGGAIVFVFAGAFNGSGTLLSSYPLRDTKFGNHIWVQLMNLLGLLTFGSLLIDTTFAMSQFLFAHNINAGLLVLATTIATLFVIVVSFGGFYTIHTAMRDAKRSRLDELANWLQQGQNERTQITSNQEALITSNQVTQFTSDQEEDFFKEIREIQEWPIDLATTFGIVSGILIPVALSFGSTITNYLSTLFHTS